MAEILDNTELPPMENIKIKRTRRPNKKIQEPVIAEVKEEEIPIIKEEAQEQPLPPPKSKKATRERMIELNQIKIKKNEGKRKQKEELKNKIEEIERIKNDKIEFEYEEAMKLKKAIEDKRAKQQIPQTKDLYKIASREILKDKYMDEVKKRVMSDLFS
jgi:hypothetical protein